MDSIQAFGGLSTTLTTTVVLTTHVIGGGMTTTQHTVDLGVDREASKHEQVRARLVEMIATLSRGDRLPPERELSATFGVSRMTLRQAISSLAESGYVSRVQGAGTFVSDPTISKSTELTGFSEDMIARGFQPSSSLLRIERRAAGPSTGRDLELSPAEPIYRIERVRMADGIPMCIETIDLPAGLVPNLELEPLERSLYAILASRYGIRLVEADQIITATVVDDEQSRLLRVPVHSPALVVKRTGYDRRRVPIERAVSIYRADRYDIRMSVRRTKD